MLKITIGNNISRHSVLLDANTTLRTALENEGIDYSIGLTSLDGSTLAPGDLDKTFADFGIAERAYLLNVVKADNAACVKIVGNACVVESAATLGDIKMLEKYRPKALSLFDGEAGKKEEVFKVGTTNGNGDINKYGASFGANAGGDDKKATITMMVPEGVADVKEWAADRVGTAILMLNKVEEQFAGAMEDVFAEKASIEDSITVM